MLAGGPPEPLATTLAPEVWGGLRRSAKQAVIGRNVRRAIDAAGGVPRGELVTLVGGCASDPEVIEAVAAELGDLDVAVARGNVLGLPRPARSGRGRPRARLRGGRDERAARARARRRRTSPEGRSARCARASRRRACRWPSSAREGTGEELGRAAAARALLGLGLGVDCRAARAPCSPPRRPRRTCEAPLADVRAFAQDAARVAGRRPLRRAAT